MIRRKTLDVLDDLIVGRVQPHIYAFTTNTIPNYLKIGDTYRPVSSRLQEWRKHFPQLHQEFEESATISDDVFFRDYSVHQYLENDLSKHRLLPGEFPNEYYSNEFFENVHVDEVSEAIKDIRENYVQGTGKYQYYDATTQLPEIFTYASTGEWTPRPNQQATIDKFVNAVKMGRSNLLMYAVMRFGKSFTSMCCAKAIDAKVILVVSAKSDVREEWKKTVQSADNFNTIYEFLTSDDLKQNKFVVKAALDKDKGAVLFLTLQDLQGDVIKDKHTEIFGQQIDLLIVDETHYGARAESYGKILRAVKDVKNKHDNDDYIEIADAEEQLKSLQVKVTLHLSGTPYRILMGSEFTKDDIIAFYQFSDIVQDQEQWDRDNLLNDNSGIKEWDNPYFGFPQMIRFAFVPSKAALELLESLKKSGITYAFSELLKPQSIKKDSSALSLHKKFVHEAEVLELFEVIDGCREDEGLLSFLDYDKIKDAKMCQHIVCVLPYCASCDALEELITRNRDLFKNLQDYVIINISGVDSPNKYSSIQTIKSKIKSCAIEGRKTLTLTVNRMLTGSTVEEWDTMLFMKDTASPQEYDQAIFRLQNQYIRELVSDNGDIIKYNMKPQTLLVDFDPHRMFIMQEKKSQIYNANTDTSGNEHLRDRLETELRISPIITLNANRVVQVEATDILAAVSEYSNSRGVIDETVDIPIDMSLLSDDTIKSTIEMQAELGSKQGLSIDANKGQETNFDEPDDNNGDNDGNKNKNKGDNADKGNGSNDNKDEDDNTQSLENKFRTYYSRVLFFAFLTKSNISSLSDILTCIDDDDNVRIAKNLSLEKSVLALIREHINVFVLRQLDYKIQNINTLAHDEMLEPMQRASVAIKKFGRISESEITTPDNIATDMINLLPDDCFTDLQDYENTRILDIASKMGEFAVAIVKHCINMGISVDSINNKVLSIPTSSISYEFTRKVYEYLGLSVSCIACKFTTYDLLAVQNKQISGQRMQDTNYQMIAKLLSQDTKLENISLNDKELEGNGLIFKAVVGNPPYQEKAKGTSSSDDPIYHLFMETAYAVSNKSVLITPARFLSNAGKTPSSWNKKMLDDEHLSVEFYEKESSNLFNGVLIPGGLAITYRDTEQKFGAIGIFTPYKELIDIDKKIKIKTNSSLSKIMYVQSKFNLEALYEDFPELKTRMSGNGKDKRFRQIVLERFPEIFTAEPPNEKYLRILGKIGSERTYRFIKRKYVLDEAWTDKYKVFIPFSNGASGTLGEEPARLISKPVVGYPGDGITQTFIGVGAFNSEDEAINLNKYIHSKFARAMLGFLKVTQGNKIDTWRMVPLLDFSDESIIDWDEDVSEIDKQLYNYYGLNSDEISFIESHVAELDL